MCRRAAASDELRRHHRRQVRLDDERIAECLHHGHARARTAAEAAVVGRQSQPEQAKIGERLPDGRAESPFGRDDPVSRVEAVVVREEPLHGVRQETLLVVVVEFHDGSPSTCLAMMLRWISFDPA